MDTYCTESHEWVRVDGDTIELGLTAHAVQELTDVTFVEIQPAGTMLGAEIHSAKSNLSKPPVIFTPRSPAKSSK